jgi:hypothetical protein
MREIEDRLHGMGADGNVDTAHNLSFEPEPMKRLLEEMCLEAGVDILLHSRVVGAVKNKQLVSHVITESKSGREAWASNIFIDASGDGDLAAQLGCGYDIGRAGDEAVQPFSLLALVTGINFDEINAFSRWAGDKGQKSKKLLLEEIVRGSVLPSYLKPGLYPIRKDLYMIMANHEYEYSPLNALDITKATLHARKEVNDIVSGLRGLGGVWKNMRLVATAEHIGIREGRRIHGVYTVTKEDLMKGARFQDGVCRVKFGVDVHSVKKDNEGGIDGSKNVSYSQGIRSKPYDIPLRALISKDVPNLMMAGRCISGDFIAHSSYRVTGNAVTMGQAAGRTAAFASTKNTEPEKVNWSKIGWKTG